jgi:arylsulfatase A-like enzyme
MRCRVLLNLVAALAATLGVAPAVAQSKPNVVLITADTLRADHLHSYGYFRRTSPAIDRLAGESLLFEIATTPIATTLPSHTSLMTSTYPARHGVVWNRPFRKARNGAPQLRMLAELLADAGYSTAAFTSASPVSAGTGIEAGFQTFDGVDGVDRPAAGKRTERRAEETAAAALAWLDGARSPFFLWIHFFDPHEPYEPPPPFDRAFVDEPELFRFLDERQFPRRSYADAAAMANRYDGEILYMDGQIARLLDRLARLGLYDEALIVFTADHGQGLLQHGFEGHGIVWNEQLRVPLLIKPPRSSAIQPGRHADLASLIDVVPTMVRAAGLPIPVDQFDGVDLRAARRRSMLSQQQHGRGAGWRKLLFTLTTERWKYFYYQDGSEPDRLYDLAADPHETRDVMRENTGVAGQMRDEIVELLRNVEKKRGFVDAPMSEGLRERLRQLGYGE